jgi:uncharacterized membrane protein YkvA (DUF1232 family)
MTKLNLAPDNGARRGIHPGIWLAAAAFYVLNPIDGDMFGPIFWLDDLLVAYLAISNWRKQHKPMSDESQIIEATVVDELE